MGHHSKSFWHQIHAPHLCQGSDISRPCGRVCWTYIKGNVNNTEHEWKIDWHDLLARTSLLESICWWSGKLKGFRSRACFNLTWEAHHRKSLRLGFSATNNEAEYEALLEGVHMVQRTGGKAIKVFSDSRLIVGQVGRELEARDERIQGYLNQIRLL